MIWVSNPARARPYEIRIYITQVKKQCGIESGEKHYFSKSEEAKQPHVTLEKKEAITKMFKHFGVIIESLVCLRQIMMIEF